MENNIFNVLIGVTGSVAAIKIPILEETIEELNKSNKNYQIKLHIITTEHAKHFFDINRLKCDTYEDAVEWSTWRKLGDSVMHIELGKLADLMVIAPLDANTLAKISVGICDNILTSTLRAWDLKKPVLFCPAMNTRMWEHPVTSIQIGVLKGWGYEEIPPISKTLACGDTGVGAMAEVHTIVERIKLIADKKFSCIKLI
ncbi:phosphopantothenoylcysteine decarboxylase isoform X1 [Leptidea sinapis]|uniref:phosphopantothenoylcysteine decarboxylase isoform X1 n=1 Tax=Leptidea sinapis TaxID=189913 RepID=UPI002146E398|nr:phosphopantothenoylcysteine decarboxylase isoform X1 [Leptidea sinapis]